MVVAKNIRNAAERSHKHDKKHIKQIIIRNILIFWVLAYFFIHRNNLLQQIVFKIYSNQTTNKTMKDITYKDLLIIIEGAFQMARKDLKIVEAEKNLLDKMLEAAGIEAEELTDFQNLSSLDIKELSRQLSSEKAKKLLLLTLVAVALADQTVDKSEKEMVDSLTKELNVGQIDIGKISYENCEKMILKLLSEK